MTCVDVQESIRIFRAKHEFGIIGDVIVTNPPTHARIDQLYEESLCRLETEERTTNTNVEYHKERITAARERITGE